MANKPASAIIHPGPGFRIRSEISRPDPSLIDKFREFSTADISDLQNRLYAMSSEIHNVVNTQVLAGPACTVKLYPGDNLMLHKALDIAKPGDVVVVDGARSVYNCVIGDLIATKAKHRGIAGFVIDGLVRDVEGLRRIDIPIFAKGVSLIGPLHRGPGEINHPICCGGIVVQPGDIVRGDADGVVIIQQDFAPEILTRLQEQRDRQREYLADVRQGRFSNEWVDNILHYAKCPIEE